MEMEYNNKSGKVDAALATGIIGTTLSVLGGAGGLLGAHYGMAGNPSAYESQMRIIEAERKNAVLESELNTEKKMVEVYTSATSHTNTVRDELSREIHALEHKVDANAAAQGVVNAQFGNQIGINTSQIAQLMSLTKFVIPNASVCPGWGNVTVQTVPSTGTTIS